MILCPRDLPGLCGSWLRRGFQASFAARRAQSTSSVGEARWPPLLPSGCRGACRARWRECLCAPGRTRRPQQWWQGLRRAVDSSPAASSPRACWLFSPSRGSCPPAPASQPLALSSRSSILGLGWGHAGGAREERKNPTGFSQFLLPSGHAGRVSRGEAESCGWPQVTKVRGAAMAGEAPAAAEAERQQSWNHHHDRALDKMKKNEECRKPQL